MERNRLYNRDHPHRESPGPARSPTESPDLSYGLTQEQSAGCWLRSKHACGMCTSR